MAADDISSAVFLRFYVFAALLLGIYMSQLQSFFKFFIAEIWLTQKKVVILCCKDE